MTGQAALTDRTPSGYPARPENSSASRNPCRALRIGFFTSSLPRLDRKPCGVDVHVDRLAEQLVRRGHDVTMFTYSPSPPGRSYGMQPLVPASTATSRLRRMLIAPLQLNALDTSALDVLHLHGDDWFYVRRRLPTVRTFYGSGLYEARHATRPRRRAAQSAAYALEVLASRLATRSYGIIPGDGPGYGTVGHLPLAVDLPEAVTYRRTGPPTVLFVGTWLGRKRGQLLHEAFLRAVRPHIPDARLVMVSDHCEVGPGVEWVPRPSDHELAELYRSAWVFCLPSSYEGFGLPYVEAMGHGTPVLASSNQGSRFVLDAGRYGRIASDEELGREITALLLDERTRTAMAKAGRRRAEEFCWEDVIDRHERAYREAIAGFNLTSVRS
jgi:glycosyltransferase involved in cell wall biosynthesis